MIIRETFPARPALLTLLLGLFAGCFWARGAPAAEAWQIEDWRLHRPQAGDAAVWRAGAGALAPVAVAGGIRFDCPFTTGADRFFWDRPLPGDVSRADGLEVVYHVESPEAFRSLMLYARSGAGWYVATLPVDREGRRVVRLPWEGFSSEGATDGPRRLSALRWSPWAGQRRDGALTLESLRAYRARVAVVRPTASAPDSGERAFGQRIADWFVTEFDRLGLACAMPDDDAVARGALAGLRLAVLPYNPQPGEAQLRALRDFVRAGGKLIVCYNLNPELAGLLQVKVGSYQRESRPGQWHAIAFDSSLLPGAPERALQTRTRNLIAVEPVEGRSRVVAWWEDAAGRREAQAAWLLSATGAWMTHVVLPEDALRKRRMLLAVSAALVPDLLDPAAQAWIAQARAIDRAGGLTASLALIEGTARRHGRRLPANWRDSLRALDDGMSAALAVGRPYEALDRAERLQHALAVHYAGAQKSPPGDEIRAVWDHYGDGLHAGDWERTAAVLRSSGLTDVFLFVPRGSVTDALDPPRRLADALRAGAARSLRMHAWKTVWTLDGIGAAERRRLEDQGRLQIGADGRVAPWLCPSQPENRLRERADAMAMARVPGVAGLHLDYVRFPDAGHCYCPSCRRLFERHQGRNVRNWPDDVRAGDALEEAFRRWRADNITAFIREISTEIRDFDPDRILSLAVFPEAERVARSIGQPWALWLREGWVDWVTPMNYTEQTGEFQRWVAAQQALPGAAGRLVPGIGVTASTSRLSAATAVGQIGITRQAGCRGFALFDLNHTLARELLPVVALLAEGR